MIHAKALKGECAWWILKTKRRPVDLVSKKGMFKYEELWGGGLCIADFHEGLVNEFIWALCGIGSIKDF